MRARISQAVSVTSWCTRLFSTARVQYRPAAAAATITPRLDSTPPLIQRAASNARQRAQSLIAQIDERKIAPTVLQSRVSSNLTDSFGRQHDYLRISLTEKCNLRCTYCMPEDGVPLMPKDHLLTTDEVERVAKMFVAQGVTKIRLTGGEPTIRKDLLDVVSRLGKLPLQSLGMTSNGIALKRRLPDLVAAGLTHLNLSLDTLDPFKFELMTRRRGFTAVMDALEIAKSLAPTHANQKQTRTQGLHTKLNVVVIRGVNDMEVPSFVELTRNSPLTVRFIEYMPFEANRWSTAKLVPSAELVQRVKVVHPDLHRVGDAVSDTTRHWQVPGFQGRVGFISSMSDHFCGSCSRLRVSADGRVKVCLFGPPVLSLRDQLRDSSIDDKTLMNQVGTAVWGKKFAHNGLGGAQGIHDRGESRSRVSLRSGLISATPVSIAARVSRSPFVRNTPQRSFLPFPPALSPGQAILGRSFSTRGAPLHEAKTRSSSASAQRQPRKLTHTDPLTGKPTMVSVSDKDVTLRSATAIGTIYLNSTAFSLIEFPRRPHENATPSSKQQVRTEASNNDGSQDMPVAAMRTKKGDVLTVAHLASIMAAKHTANLIPLCHPLNLTSIHVMLEPLPEARAIRIRATVECEGRTGVEMEALTSVSVGCLTVWDMCKAVAGEEMRIGDIMVVEKKGGKSGDWVRHADELR